MEDFSETLRCARRNLSSLHEYERIEDWQWDTTKKVWYLHFAIHLSRSCSHIPSCTEWYITTTSNYPFGKIKVYPSAINGISATFPHQSCNAFIETNGLWCKGDLCLASISASLSQSAFDKAPTDVATCLYWHVARTIQWLYAAVDGTLVSDNDLFESPDFSARKSVSYCAVYNEDSVSFLNWSDESEPDWRSGIVDYICKTNDYRHYLIPKQYSSFDKEFFFSPPWGTAYQQSSANPHRKGLWLLLKHVPVINVWQAPTTLGELCSCCDADGIDLMQALHHFSSLCRDGYQHPVSIGFPIPKKMNEPAKEIAWKTFLLPVLSYKTSYTDKLGVRKGFRFNEVGWSFNDETTILVKEMELQWMASENWNRSTISSRGHMPEEIQYKRILLIGCGSLGSSIAEILARSATYNITCMDSESFSAGNLCRHVLTSASLSCPKASALASHLKDINPCIKVQGLSQRLELTDSDCPSVDLAPYDIIIDTTGEDSVLTILASAHYIRRKNFISCSVGLGAKHLYFGAQNTHQANFSQFRSIVAPYCKADISNYDVMDLPRDGIGCWHPLFPARSDDMWLAAATSTKAMESFVTHSTASEITIVYEQQYTGSVFEGYHSIEVQSL